MGLDFFRRSYDKALGSGYYGLDNWINSEMFFDRDEGGEWTGFFCCEIVWNL